MRPLSYRSDALRALLLRNQIATFDEMKQALGNPVDVTVFRKLKPLDYLSSYSHRGRYYTLREIARFDDHGLWSQADVWFSRCGTLLATAELFVNRSPRGFVGDQARQTGSKSRTPHRGGKFGPGGPAAVRAGHFMALILGDVRPQGRQFGDLITMDFTPRLDLLELLGQRLVAVAATHGQHGHGF